MSLPEFREALAVELIDPSTGRSYLIRVDPDAYGGIRTVRATIASTWRYPDGSLVFKRPEDCVLAAEA
jgi:hypothetical protein